MALLSKKNPKTQTKAKKPRSGYKNTGVAPLPLHLYSLPSPLPYKKSTDFHDSRICTVCAAFAPDIKQGSRNIETYNTGWFQCGYKGIHQYTHTHWLGWSYYRI